VISLHRREATTQSTDKGPDAGHAGRHSTMPRQPLTTTPRCCRDGGRPKNYDRMSAEIR
jgi:hypothetical protein